MPGKWEKGVRTKRRSISLRHEQLVDLYFGIANFQKCKAMRLAGYKDPEGYCRVFDHPDIVREVDKRHRALRKRYKVSYARTVEEIAKVAYGNVADYADVDDEGNLVLTFTGADADVMATIGEVTTETTSHMETGKDGKKHKVTVTKMKVKPYNKLSALDQLMRHAGLSKDKTSEAVTALLADRIRGAEARLGNETEAKKEDEDDDS